MNDIGKINMLRVLESHNRRLLRLEHNAKLITDEFFDKYMMESDKKEVQLKALLRR